MRAHSSNQSDLTAAAVHHRLKCIALDVLAELEVRWHGGTLFAKVTAESVPPLASFVPGANVASSWSRRAKAVETAGYYCEAYPRSTKDECVMEWRALKWLLEQRNRTTRDGRAPFVSPCVPSTQYDASKLHRWMQWADQVRGTHAWYLRFADRR